MACARWYTPALSARHLGLVEAHKVRWAMRRTVCGEDATQHCFGLVGLHHLCHEEGQLEEDSQA